MNAHDNNNLQNSSMSRRTASRHEKQNKFSSYDEDRFPQVNGENNGRAEVEVLANSGTSPYEFLWSNGVTTALNSSLSAGSSTCTVTDFNGCQEVISVSIDEPVELVLNILNVEDNLCFGDQKVLTF